MARPTSRQPTSPPAHQPTLRLTKSCFVIALPVLLPKVPVFQPSAYKALVDLLEQHEEAVGCGLESRHWSMRR